MGIFAGSKSARASGGSISTVGQYVVHAFTTTGANTFTPTTTGFVDLLLVGGGGGSGGFSGGNGVGGGAGATLFKKMIPVTAGTPYSISVGTGSVSSISASPGPGTPTTFTYSGITTTAAGGAGGGDGTSPGISSPNASGSGGGNPNLSGGTGAGVLGIGFPGFRGNDGAGGGAGSGGPISTPSNVGGTGVPIAYFTGTPTDIVSYGGYGRPIGVNVPSLGISTLSTAWYGNGGPAMAPQGIGQYTNGRQGVAYIRYI